MKTISVRQPFASFIIAGLKHYKTRSWPLRYQGRLAIHASKMYDAVDRAITDELCALYPRVAAVVARRGRAAWHIVKVVDRFDKPVPAVGKPGVWEWTS